MQLSTSELVKETDARWGKSVVFCKLMDQVGHQWSAIPRKLYIKLFVSECHSISSASPTAPDTPSPSSAVGDMISLVLQGTGGGLNASGGTNMVSFVDLCGQ